MRIAAAEELFACGLLAHVGKLAFATLYPAGYSEILAKASAQSDADLRSLTQGVGYFTMEPSHYDPVPPYAAQKIIEKRRAEGKVKGAEEEK